MPIRSLTAIAACAAGIFVSSEAFARARVTTDDCLAKGLCAYVSPKGRVTCGRCPGQKAVLWRRGAPPALCTYTPPRGRSVREAIRCASPSRK